MKFFKALNKPEVQMWIYGFGILFFFGLWGAAAFFGWTKSTVFVSHVSMVALILSVWTMWQAVRGELREKRDAEKK